MRAPAYLWHALAALLMVIIPTTNPATAPPPAHSPPASTAVAASTAVYEVRRLVLATRGAPGAGGFGSVRKFTAGVFYFQFDDQLFRRDDGRRLPLGLIYDATFHGNTSWGTISDLVELRCAGNRSFRPRPEPVLRSWKARGSPSAGNGTHTHSRKRRSLRPGELVFSNEANYPDYLTKLFTMYALPRAGGALAAGLLPTGAATDAGNANRTVACFMLLLSEEIDGHFEQVMDEDSLSSCELHFLHSVIVDRAAHSSPRYNRSNGSSDILNSTNGSFASGAHGGGKWTVENRTVSPVRFAPRRWSAAQTSPLAWKDVYSTSWRLAATEAHEAQDAHSTNAAESRQTAHATGAAGGGVHYQEKHPPSEPVNGVNATHMPRSPYAPHKGRGAGHEAGHSGAWSPATNRTYRQQFMNVSAYVFTSRVHTSSFFCACVTEYF